MKSTLINHTINALAWILAAYDFVTGKKSLVATDEVAETQTAESAPTMTVTSKAEKTRAILNSTTKKAEDLPGHNLHALYKNSRGVAKTTKSNT